MTSILGCLVVIEKAHHPAFGDAGRSAQDRYPTEFPSSTLIPAQSVSN
jgi:hypothetical protein